MIEQAEIIAVEPERVYPLRQQVLRSGQPMDCVVNPGDDHPESIHVAAIIDNEVVGVMSIMPDEQPGVAGLAWRIRGMATAPDFRGCGIGRLMIEFGITRAMNTRRADVWCNAREVAFGFYEKHGFIRVGGLFDIEGIGVHSVMVLTAR